MRPFRLMNLEDIPALNRLQVECYSPGMQEDESTMRARLRLAPDTAWVAEDESGVCAYLVGYRSAIGKISPLNGLFVSLPDGDTLYLHDLAVSRRCRGRSIGTALVRHALRTAAADGLSYSALVSVQGSRPFWERLGYAVREGLEPAALENLHTYEGPAWYMVRRLEPSRA